MVVDHEPVEMELCELSPTSTPIRTTAGSAAAPVPIIAAAVAAAAAIETGTNRAPAWGAAAAAAAATAGPPGLFAPLPPAFPPMSPPPPPPQPQQPPGSNVRVMKSEDLRRAVKEEGYGSDADDVNAQHHNVHQTPGSHFSHEHGVAWQSPGSWAGVAGYNGAQMYCYGQMQQSFYAPVRMEWLTSRGLPVKRPSC